MIITTTETIPFRSIVEIIGIVQGKNIKDIEKAAESIGAHGVVCVKFNTHGGLLFGKHTVVYGTAVRLTLNRQD